MQNATEAQDPDPRTVRVIVAELPRELAFGFTTPDGERVCIVDPRASDEILNGAHESAHKAFWELWAS